LCSSTLGQAALFLAHRRGIPEDMADRDLANHNAKLAAKVTVMPGLDVRLAFIDSASNADKYHVAQGLTDPMVGGNPMCHYLFQRWGETGYRGQMQVDGPMLQSEVAVAFAKIFEEKTGATWGSLKPGDRALPGKYWLQQQSTPDLSAKWEYHVNDRVDGKRTGWHPYNNYASEEVEEVYAQHTANGGEARTATRVVASGHFSYTVNLAKMTQQNTKTKTVRTIRRSAGEQSSASFSRKRSAGESASAPPMKVMKVRIASHSVVTEMKLTPTSAATKKKAMKAIKKAKALLKTMKKVTKVGTKSQVLKGSKMKTKGGMKASDLMKNKHGKVVSKKKHMQGKKAYEKNLAKWSQACSKARKELGLKGFVAIKKSSDFYNRTKDLMSE